MGSNSSRGSGSGGGVLASSHASKTSAFTKSKSPTYEAERFTRPTGLYKSCLWDQKVVRKLIVNRKIAPRYPGSEIPTLDSYECPICFLYYPSTLNQSSCCKQAICTECFLQTKPPNKAVCCPFCNTDNFRTNFTVGSTGSLKPIFRSDSGCTELSSPEASSMSDDIEVHFASVADRQKLQAELSAQVGLVTRPQPLPNHRSTTYAAFVGSDDHDSTSCLEEMMIMEAIRRSMLECEPKHRDHHTSTTISHRGQGLIPSAAPSAAS
ncbi:Aste57867_11040 [Aphanomyces stellatus]|uniref:Aste57867_11040 protein n=1 Tax=Aphanomyces stellatus TaxID=120398 RepID=A0A485KT28_9STRA|nr:hypothetical protein As57867_010998 [Aphanomyces stellatus]VFT87908.1 Aste57867_11040 [Aphanomyces stellatus]